MRLPVVGVVVALLALAGVAGGCYKIPQEPLKLEGNRLTVDNRTADDWTNVEIWLNTYYRVTVPSIAAGGRFQVPLDMFVAGLGQRFNFQRMQVRDLKLKAKRRGEPFELRKEFELDGLAGVAADMKKKR
jgi:hypothetical protein